MTHILDKNESLLYLFKLNNAKFYYQKQYKKILLKYKSKYYSYLYDESHMFTSSDTDHIIIFNNNHVFSSIDGYWVFAEGSYINNGNVTGISYNDFKNLLDSSDYSVLEILE